MLHYGPRNSTHPFGIFYNLRHFGGAFREFCLVTFEQIGGNIAECFVNCVLVYALSDKARLKVGRQGRLVTNGFLERIAAHMAVLVLVCAKCPERVAVALVDWCVGETKEKGVGQRPAHLAPQITLLHAVRFVHQGNDIVPQVQYARCLAKFMNHGDDDFANILREQLLQFVARRRRHHVRHIGGVKGTSDLRLERVA